MKIYFWLTINVIDFATLRQIQFRKYKFWINDVIPSVRNKLVANVIDFANVSNCFFWFHIMCPTFYMQAQRWLLAVDLMQYGLYKNDIAFMMTFALMLKNILMTHISCNSFQNYMMQSYFVNIHPQFLSKSLNWQYRSDTSVNI